MGSIDKACISGFLCRLCSEMHRIVIHIYGDQGQRMCLVEKINGYLPITISPTDPLPKTICETCLRRVEQHYDLLMRLSRIKEERFMRVNKPQTATEDVSSPDMSEDDLYNSDEERRRTRPVLVVPSHGTASTSTAAGAVNNMYAVPPTVTGNLSRRPPSRVALEDVSSPDMSEDDLYNSDEERRRTRPVLVDPSHGTESTYTAAGAAAAVNNMYAAPPTVTGNLSRRPSSRVAASSANLESEMELIG